MNATVRADEAREMEIWREEVFPPVVVGPVGTIDDAEAAVSKRAHVGGVRSRGGGPALLDQAQDPRSQMKVCTAQQRTGAGRTTT